MWPAFTFNLVAALLIAGWYLRAVRRLERRMDERMRRFDEWADAEEAKALAASAEIRASLRARVDKAIDEMQAKVSRRTGSDPAAQRGGLHYSCDICGKDLPPESVRLVVRAEVPAGVDLNQWHDLDADQKMAQLGSEVEDGDVSDSDLPSCRRQRFDMCSDCYRKFLSDRLGREDQAKLLFGTDLHDTPPAEGS